MSGTRLILVRHGESRANADKYIGGPRSCMGLTDLGRRQVEALRDRILVGRDVVATALYSSNFPRAIETATVLAPALGSLPMTIEAGWGEHDPGPDCDGMPFSEFVDRFGEPDWDGDPHEVTYPGGETVADFHDRVNQTMKRTIRENVGGTVVVSTHGGVVDRVMRTILHGATTGKFELYTLNASITEVVHVGGSKWRLVRYNDASHLNDVDPFGSAGR